MIVRHCLTLITCIFALAASATSVDLDFSHKGILLVEKSDEAQQVKIDPNADLPPMPSQFLTAPPLLPRKVFFHPQRNPHSVCEASATGGFELSAWSPVFLQPQEEWSCFSNVREFQQPILGEQNQGVTTVFFVIRGSGEHRISNMFFKLNIEDRAASEFARTALIDTLQSVSNALDWAVPRQVVDAIDTFTPMDEKFYGVRVEFDSVFGDEPRYFLKIAFPEPKAIQKDQNPKSSEFFALRTRLQRGAAIGVDPDAHIN